MEESAYLQYVLERDNWLKAGRKKLLADQVRKAVGGRSDLEILDLGAGVGQNVPPLRAFGAVDVLEINEIGLKALRAMDCIREIFDKPIPYKLDRLYDVIVATDVLEHIPDDKAAARWIAEHLKPGGIFFSTVPAYQFLFGEHDVALHHFRRYSASSYARIMRPHLTVERCGYFNSALFPIAAMMRLASKVLAPMRRSAPKKQSGMVPPLVNSAFERVLAGEVWMIARGITPPFGLSVFCLARKV